MKQLYRLSDLELDEISFVDKGANPLARIVISKKGEPMDENTSFAISKNHPAAALISKCVTAARSGNYSGLTRQEIDHVLDTVAKSVAEERGIDYQTAFEAVMSGPDGQALYQARELCPPEGEGGSVRKEELSKAELLEREAEHFAETYTVDIATARQFVASYYEK
jgi:hypothetical protein